MASATTNKYLIALARWFDTSAGGTPAADGPQKTDWFRCIPFVFVHLMCLGVIWVGWSPIAVGVAIALYFVRMFAITGFYHRYFSHRSFKTTRAAQFVFAVMGATCVQRGPLWWASHHRLHHQRSDEPEDVHSPRQHGFIWSHIGWITSESNFRSELRVVRDFAKFPELMFLDRFDVLDADRARLRALTDWAHYFSARLPVCTPPARRCSSGDSSSRRWCSRTARLRSTRSRTCSGAAATRPATTAATASRSRWSRSARAGTTITTITRPRRATGFSGGRSTSPTTLSRCSKLLGSSGISARCPSSCSTKIAWTRSLA